MKDDFRTIGQRIRQARIENGMTQQELADRTGYNFSSISRIEHGDVDLPVSKIKLFARVLRVSAMFLMEDYLAQDDRTPEEKFNDLPQAERLRLYEKMMEAYENGKC